MDTTSKASAVPADLFPQRSRFDPLFRNGHLQTIMGRYWPVSLDEARWPTTELLFNTEPGVQILAHGNRQADGSTRGTIVAVHGLTASSQAPYMKTLAQAGLEAGFDVIRLNVRNCGGTEHLSPTLYHSGLTVDLARIVEQLAPAAVLLAGFSMGGNMALKLAGEWGECPPAHVAGVCAVSAPIELEACARRLGQSGNRIYEVRFLRALRATLRRKQALRPKDFSALRMDGIESIYEFDDRITAPAFGFRNASHYYEESSSSRFLPSVRVPALLLQAKDDPFIPFGVFGRRCFAENRHLHLAAEDHGGHLAFLSRGASRFWAIEQAVQFFLALSRQQSRTN